MHHNKASVVALGWAQCCCSPSPVAPPVVPWAHAAASAVLVGAHPVTGVSESMCCYLLLFAAIGCLLVRNSVPLFGEKGSRPSSALLHAVPRCSEVMGFLK